MTVGVAREGLAVANAGSGVDRVDGRSAARDRRQARRVQFRFPLRFLRSLAATALGRFHGGEARVGAVLLEEPHRVHVERIGGPPERGGALQVDAAAAQHAEGVLHVPEVTGEAGVGVGAGLEKRLHQIEVGCVLMEVLGGMGVRCPRCPLAFQDRVEGGGPGLACQVRVGAALEEDRGEVELAVDGGHEEGSGPVAGRWLVDVGAPVEQRQRHLGVPLPHRVKQRREPAPAADGLGVGQGTRLLVLFRVVLSLGGIGILAGLGSPFFPGDLSLLVRQLAFLAGFPLPLLLLRIVVRRVGHVGPAALDLAGGLDRGLDLARGGLPVGAPALLLAKGSDELVEAALGGGIGIRFFVTTGNECDVDVAETIGWLARQPDISVIVAYIEGIADRDRLLESLALARERGKPVVLQKVGRTEIGADAVRSHTATLAGSDAVYDGVFRQFGVHRARDAEEMLDVAYAATFGAFPASRRVALMSISGGVGVQMADEAVACGLDVAPMSDRAQARLKAQLPYASPRNPVDITAQAFNDLDLIRSNLDVILEEDAYDAVVAFFTFVAAAEAMVEPVRAILQDARRRHSDRLLVLSIVGPPDVVQHYEAAGCPVFEDPSRAVRAVAALARLAESFDRPTSAPAVTPAAAPLPPTPTGEAAARRAFADAGIPMVESRLCAGPREAARAAAQLGFPAAVKIASPDIAHKSDIGGVALDLDAADDVAQAAATILRKARSARPDARIDGVLVSPMVRDGVEMILGVQHDPTFGPVVMCGLGGVFVEVLADVAFRPAPFDAAEAHRMLRELRGFPLLAGARGRPPGDVDALAAAIAALSRFAAAHAGELESAELNPVVVRPAGQGVVALDALIVTTTGAG